MPEPTTVPAWTTRRLSVSPISAVAVTVHELESGRPGPNLLVLGGVHGDEVGGIVAAGRVASTPWPLLRGRITVVPITHEAAYAADARVSPLDGGNLARSFPGALGGSPTEELAWLVGHRLIASADALIDLHTSNAKTDMPLFVGCLDDGSPQAAEAVRLARGFGMRLLWTHPALGPGRTLTVAQERGIPALYVESPVGGVLEDAFVDAYVEGVRSVLEGLGLIEPATDTGARPRPEPELWLHGNGDTDTFSSTRTAGLFDRSVALLDQVRRGQLVGRVLDPLGDVLEDVLAPANGFVTTLQRSARVERGQPVVAVTARRPPELGLPTDHFTSRTRSMR
ncbi:succinylglutamate desuccinylase/aspartoacylase family protein [Herbiconiux sp. P17]|uniref:succinylglutamate desuccinylase/aspartoacylase family protein n=1 Tax=Herbiconiux wuyangfengii TaxID=3342794 RepID=UPI0035B700F7